MTFTREGERFEGPTFPEVVSNGTAEMAHARGAGLVGSDTVQRLVFRLADEGIGRGGWVDGWRRWSGDFFGMLGLVISLGGIGAEEEGRVEEREAVGERRRSYPRLKHC